MVVYVEPPYETTCGIVQVEVLPELFGATLKTFYAQKRISGEDGVIRVDFDQDGDMMRKLYTIYIEEEDLKDEDENERLHEEVFIKGDIINTVKTVDPPEGMMMAPKMIITYMFYSPCLCVRELPQVLTRGF